ncbi:acyltransferase family protein [Cystobacter ferrugineus]|uniref:Acyltransferase n=1 Tax=Cystobacter ferrugineus TaxID=83449 RepID=A0A1L9AXR5_9BACT|nr:acyltransferase [Cystobacter ferrugineus]OJH34776.1 acyltransferase [Cystobacter ferrugineus]
MPSADTAPQVFLPHQAFLRTRTFKALDGLRALAIFAVVFYHVSEWREGFVGRFYLSVSLFFAISGFLITTLLLRERDATGGISLMKFYVRRSLRIFPLYYAVCALYIVLVAGLEQDVLVRATFFDNVRYYLTYTSNWFIPLSEGRVVFFFAWSMATEEQFYLLWPCVVRHFKRRGGPVVFMSGLLLVGWLADWGVRSGVLDTRWLWVRMLDSISISICMGCLAAYLTHSPRSFAWTWKVLGQPWSVPVLVVLTAAAVRYRETPLVVSSLLFTALTVAMCIRPRHVLAPLVEHPALRYVGSISYGIYLMHMLALNLVRRLVPHDVVPSPLVVHYVLTLAVSIGLATLSYRYFESPFLRLKNRFAWRDGASPRLTARSPVVPSELGAPVSPG